MLIYYIIKGKCHQNASRLNNKCETVEIIETSLNVEKYL